MLAICFTKTLSFGLLFLPNASFWLLVHRHVDYLFIQAMPFWLLFHTFDVILATFSKLPNRTSEIHEGQKLRDRRICSAGFAGICHNRNTISELLHKTQKWTNTEPQGLPEGLNRFFGKLLTFPRRWRGREELKPTKQGCFFDAEKC